MVTCPWPLSNSFLGIGLVKATRGMTDGVTDENAHRRGLGLFGRAHGMMRFGNKETKSDVSRHGSGERTTWPGERCPRLSEPSSTSHSQQMAPSRHSSRGSVDTTYLAPARFGIFRHDRVVSPEVWI